MVTGYIPYSAFVRGNFTFNLHRCRSDCNCVMLGCSHHWQWKNGKPPQKESVRYQLATWQAFRNKPFDAQLRYLDNYEKIAKLLAPLFGTCVACDWQEDIVMSVYEQVRDIYDGYVVPTTKTLHMFLPDLFVILDRQQVFAKWKTEMRTPHFNALAGQIDAVDGKKYVGLMHRVRGKISLSIKEGVPFTLAGSPGKQIASVDELRLISPLGGDRQQKLPNTLGKVLDNIIRNQRLEL